MINDAHLSFFSKTKFLIFNMKSNKIISTWVAVISLLATASCKENSLGYVKSEKIIDEYAGSISRRNEFVNKSKIWQANLDSLAAELNALPVNKRSLKEQQFNVYKNSIQQKAMNEKDLINNIILNEINMFINKYGKENGYGIILGATENGNIVYASDEKDITNEILSGLNDQYIKHNPVKK